jgi:uncharacterized protein YgbK (DUF1537 family)
VIVFGGDTAEAVLRAAGIGALLPLGEVMPGVAAARAGSRVFVTKAGGFGPEDVVEQIVRRWKT